MRNRNISQVESPRVKESKKGDREEEGLTT
jgi:hypothetical protein